MSVIIDYCGSDMTYSTIPANKIMLAQNFGIYYISATVPDELKIINISDLPDFCIDFFLCGVNITLPSKQSAITFACFV